ncbi:hypothetical protein HELRODRAFT_107185 [Helobdella robusta]|uniref:Uncharacterized protein n=1 Tax=Helobdella robusta TaxID=6412 RepID=T1EE86_HELRO|nr:hypothetical protein HELRODRAFT_107185 [Helobdella robusta]ESN99156.1 hypothetical protein HELRODRAFT_107185 [Helobdella robusta]
MLDRSRLVLCIFMFSMFAFNPLGLFLGGFMSFFMSAPDQHSVSTGRVLQSEAESDMVDVQYWFQSILPSFVVWSMNCLVGVVIIMKLFVFGEPLTKPMSPSSVLYWRKRNQAEIELLRKSYIEASSLLSGCLMALGRPLPTTKFDVFASLVWNLIRQLLHRIHLGLWLEMISGKLCKGVSRKDIQSSARDATVVYHKLLQLHLTDHVSQGTYAGINLALCTINLAEVSGEALPKGMLAEIYTLIAMSIRIMLPTHFHFLARYFLTMARSICFTSCNVIPASLSWLNNPLGHRYFVDATWNMQMDKSIFTSCLNQVDPLAHILQNFRENLLEKAVLALVTPGYKKKYNHLNKYENDWSVLCFLTTCSAVTELINCNFLNAGSATTLPTRADDLSKWWSSLLAVAAHWLNEEEQYAERFYSVVDTLPKFLQKSSDPLVRSVYMAFRARRYSLMDADESGSGSNINNVHVETCKQLCNKASNLLKESIELHTMQSNNKIIQAFQLLTCDWLLVTRTEMWQCGRSERSSDEENVVNTTTAANNNGNIHVYTSDLFDFQSDLASLRKLAGHLKAAMPKVFAHEATARLMAGASPSRTLQLFGRDLRKRNNTQKCFSKNNQLVGCSPSEAEKNEDDDKKTSKKMMMLLKHRELLKSNEKDVVHNKLSIKQHIHNNFSARITQPTRRK